MARKKKTEKKVETVNVVDEKLSNTIEDNPRKGQVFYKDYKDIPGNVLGRVYQVDGVKARLVYIGEKCKFIIE